MFGRIAHIIDAVEDQATDTWNPLSATGTSAAEARKHCDDALLGIRLALDEVEFVDDRLVRVLLVDEVERAVNRAFAHASGKRRRKKKKKDEQSVGFGGDAVDMGVSDAAHVARGGKGCFSHCDCCDCCS